MSKQEVQNKKASLRHTKIIPLASKYNKKAAKVINNQAI